MKSSGYLNWLKRWIDGRLTADEERQLEQAAREDAFLRDALEGLRSNAEADHELHLSRLRKKIGQSPSQKQKGRIIPLTLRRIAAAALLILGLGSIWWLNRPLAPQEISMEEQDSSSPVDPSESATPGVDQPSIETAPETPSSSEPAPPPAPRPAAKPEVITPKTEPATPSNYSIDEDRAVQNLEAEEAAPPPLVEAEPRAVLPRRSPSLPQATEALPLESLNGRIIDMEGQPVAGAVIVNQLGEQEAISDAAGNFKIAGAPLGVDSTLAVRHFNYADTNLRIASPPAETVVLQMRRPTARKQASRSLERLQPLPVGGFDYFRSDSEAYRNFITDRRIERNPITIAFTVYPYGKIGNFEIRSLASDNQIEQVSDFLKNGPQWVLPSGVDSLRTQITIPVQE